MLKQREYQPEQYAKFTDEYTDPVGRVFKVGADCVLRPEAGLPNGEVTISRIEYYMEKWRCHLTAEGCEGELIRNFRVNKKL